MGKLFVFLFFLTIGLVNCYETISKNREGRVFSLFNIVKFDNAPCSSSESLTTSSTGSSNYNGTCFSSSECSDKGGKSKGSCAAGFGVCCLFLLNTDTATTISYNNSYIQNPGFPTALSEAKSITYTVNKCSDDICFLRLDFEQFDISGPINSCEADSQGCAAWVDTGIADGGGCTVDKMAVKGSTDGFVPDICGLNNGQHIYVPMGEVGSTTSATVEFTTTGTASVSRNWNILVSQIPCSKSYTPPSGCLQYFTGTSGKIKTFNFDGGDTTTHLANQNYQACIRQAVGMCCNQYTVCDGTSETLPFSIYPNSDSKTAMSPTLCIQDYITIEGGTSVCSTGPNTGTTRSKFCGTLFSLDLTSKTTDMPVCDCTPSFAVGVVTDALTDNKNKVNDAALGIRSRGVCLNFMQMPC